MFGINQSGHSIVYLFSVELFLSDSIDKDQSSAAIYIP
jgi:hypothetical protein